MIPSSTIFAVMANWRCTAPPNISGAIKHQIGTICPKTKSKIRKQRPPIKSRETWKMPGNLGIFRKNHLENFPKEIWADDVKTENIHLVANFPEWEIIVHFVDKNCQTQSHQCYKTIFIFAFSKFSQDYQLKRHCMCFFICRLVECVKARDTMIAR